MLRSVSEPSFQSSIGTATIRTNATGDSRGVPATLPRADRCKAHPLFEGHFKKYTLRFLLLPWKMWWQFLIIFTIMTRFVIRFLASYYYGSYSIKTFEYTLHLTESLFVLDLVIHLLHAEWGEVRYHIRVYRRSRALLYWDLFTAIPVTLIMDLVCKETDTVFILVRTLGQWVAITRLYRIYTFFSTINCSMRSSRTLLFILEHMVVCGLILHASTCIFYHLQMKAMDNKPWYGLGWPEHISASKIKFDTYMQCWYYCTCRFFNVIFGDSYPMETSTKIMTSALMLIGCTLIKHRFINYLAWELAVEDDRWTTFVDRYHHLLDYLRFCGAPPSLVEQAKNYKLSLWKMKDGILRSNHLKKLPYPLQMELIFDINVAHIHNSLLFRDTGEAFMRQESLIMQHEIFLEGQQVWSQGVVKGGMVCVKRGVVEMLSDEDDESPMIAFGEGTVSKYESPMIAFSEGTVNVM